MAPQPRRPGDQIIDKYMPNATPEEREIAHERLRNLAKVLIRIEKRRVLEGHPPAFLEMIPNNDRSSFKASKTT